MTEKKLSTKILKSAINRSNFNETSEALFLTSGFVYKSAQEAEKAFKDEKKRFMYSRFGNPTVEIFQKEWLYLRALRIVGLRLLEWQHFYHSNVISKIR